MLNDMMLCEELFRTPTGVAFADFLTEGRREMAHSANSEHGCSTVVARRPTGCSETEIRSGARPPGSAAQFVARSRVHVRIAEHGGRIYLDLADGNSGPSTRT
jgi:hypothetical protein